MPRFMRRRSGGKYNARRPVGWDGARVLYARSRSSALRSMGSRSLAGALSRVHMFKRVGQPIVLANNSATSVERLGTTDLIQPTSISAVGGTLAGCDRVLAAMRFCLAQASQVSDITSLFDNYRIAKIKLNFTLTVNSAPGTSNTGPAGALLTSIGAVPYIHYCYDPDDDAVPGSREAVLANGYCKSRALDKSFSITITPRAQQPVTGGVAGAGGVLPLGQWLDCDSTQIYHYGMKFCIDNWPQLPAASNRTIGLQITPTYYIEGKNVV